MTTYEHFKNSCLDLTILRLQDESSFKGSPAPENARILGWLTDAPICFCQMSEHGETVFAVDSNAAPESQMIPIAEDLPHFIGLLICCQDAALIAGAYQWSSFRFKELISNLTPSMKAQSVIRALKNTYQPPIIDDPGAMMSQLRKKHQSASPRTPWQVGFDHDFLQPCKNSAYGKELVLNRCISLNDDTWYVPSVFICDDGIVVDTLMEVSIERLLEFRSKWQARCDETLAIADKLQRQLDDPLDTSINGILTVNDRPLRFKRSFSATWNPLCDNPTKSLDILNHYCLDPDKGYLFRRYCFLRKAKYPKIRSMQLTLAAQSVLVPDRIFTVHEDGEQFRFKHPATGLEHCFTAVRQSSEALNPNFLTNHPCFYTRLTYALEPSISPDNFRITDCDPGDQWEGYQDEPAAVIYADRKPDPGRYALSSLHYEPADHIQWQMIFRRKLHQDIHINLLP